MILINNIFFLKGNDNLDLFIFSTLKNVKIKTT